MSVKLDYRCCTAWDNMVKHFGEHSEGSDTIRNLTAELAVFGAHTNFNDAEDPVWFPDQQSLAHFLLIWS